MSGADTDGAVIWGVRRLELYPVRAPLPFCASRCADLARMRIQRKDGRNQRVGWRVLDAGLDDDGVLRGIGGKPLSRWLDSREAAEAFALTINIAGQP